MKKSRGCLLTSFVIEGLLSTFWLAVQSDRMWPTALGVTLGIVAGAAIVETARHRSANISDGLALFILGPSPFAALYGQTGSSFTHLSAGVVGFACTCVIVLHALTRTANPSRSQGGDKPTPQ
jgi:hypothetical protein